MFVCVTTDDLCPEFLPEWYAFWDKLKERHPKLQVTAFVVPVWWGNEKNDVAKSVEFKRWYDERKDWVYIAQHGLKHTKPPECQKFYKSQYSLISKGLRKLKKMMKPVYGFKPPFYRMNDATFRVLSELGFSYVVYWNHLILLEKQIKHIDFKMISSHTNMLEYNEDDIRYTFKGLDKWLTLLEETGHTYTNLNELVYMMIKEK